MKFKDLPEDLTNHTVTITASRISVLTPEKKRVNIPINIRWDSFHGEGCRTLAVEDATRRMSAKLIDLVARGATFISARGDRISTH